jgi:hypothetical protein
MYRKFGLENLKGRDHLGDLGIDGKKILKWILGKLGVEVWTRFICFWTGTGGGTL